MTGWTPSNGKIWQAPVAWDLGIGRNQVFVDGIMMPEARTPNHTGVDWLHPTLADITLDGAANTITSPSFGGVPDNYWAGAWFVGRVGYAWQFQMAKIISSSNNAVTYDPKTKSEYWFNGNCLPADSCPGVGLGQGYLFGVANALDAPGEWFLQGGSMLLRTPDDGNPANHLVEVKRRLWTVDLQAGRITTSFRD